MDKVCIGVPCYGSQTPDWWGSLVTTVALMRDDGVSFEGVLKSASMAVDGNRNAICASFLDTSKADWIWWLDADTVPPFGALRRLLGNGKPLISGLYYLKSPPYTPVAYTRNSTGNYNPIHDWNRGEIIPINMAGMGCVLMHRSILEEYKKQFTIVERDGGGITIIHNSRIQSMDWTKSETDNRVINGVWHVPVHPPTYKVEIFPFFIQEFNRTEDVMFFENAALSGAELWVDTSVECKHERNKPVTGNDYRHALYTAQGFIPPAFIE